MPVVALLLAPSKSLENETMSKIKNSLLTMCIMPEIHRDSSVRYGDF